MTWLLRKIDDLDPWFRLAESTDIEALVNEPPLWAVRLFIPSPKDQGSLSLYEVADEAEAKVVAGAWGFTLGDIDKAATKVSFVAAPRQQIEDAGFVVTATPGGLNHVCDRQHRGICPQTVLQASKLAGLVIAGELFTFEGKIVQKVAMVEAQETRFDFAPIAKRGSQVTAARNILKLVGSSDLTVSGP